MSEIKTLAVGEKVRVVFINNYTIDEEITIEALMEKVLNGELIFHGGPEIFQIQNQEGVVLKEEN